MDRQKIEIRLSPRQSRAFDILEDPCVRSMLYGGAKGGGKSVFACIYNYHYAGKIIQEFGLKPTPNPIPIAFMGRLRAEDFKKTTFESWKRIIPAPCYRVNKTEKEIIIAETVKIFYGGLDDKKTVNKFNSAEFGMITIDQAEEVTKDEVAVLRASLRLKIAGRELPYKELFTANPAQCWLKSEFIDAKPDEVTNNRRKVFVQALPSDNPHLASGYIQTLTDQFKHRPELLEAYLHGSWDAFAGDDQIIREQWLRAAMARHFHYEHRRRFLVCDVARFGDDETCIMLFNETDVEKCKVFGKKDTMHTANVLHICAVQEGVSAVVGDSNGVGAGVFDRLREMANGQYDVIEINSAEAPRKKPEVYGNLRAEMWDMVGAMLEMGEVELTYDDQVLVNQLCGPKYYFRNGKMWCEKKEDIKKRLGRSPDRADTYVMGLYIRDSIPVSESGREKKQRRSYLSRHRSAVSAMAS
jgi:hypothetical protein